MEKCLYKKIYSKNDIIVTCNLSEELRKEYADTIWDMFDKRPSSYKWDPRSDLHDLFLAFWADNGSKKQCSVEIVSGRSYGFVNRSGFKITASGNENSYRAETYDAKTNQKLSMDHNGKIKGGEPPRDINIAMRKECVITKKGKIVHPK